MSGHKLLIAFPLDDQLVKRIRSTLNFDSVSYYPATFVPGTKHPEALWSWEPPPVPKDVWASATILMTMFFVPSSRSEAPNLKFIQGMSAGLDHLLPTRFIRETPEINLATASGVHATNIAEYVLMQSLNAIHRQSVLREIQSVDKKWARTKYVPPASLSGSAELRDHKIGILGYGAIGRECGRLASAFGMTVLAVSSTGKKSPAKSFVVPGTGDADGSIPEEWYSSNDEVSLKSFLQQLDFLVLACPLTPTTRNIISDKTIRYLKSSTYIVNISRGLVVDHDALYIALEEERIAGAILDVTDPEPLPEGHRLWTAKNCVITPHISGSGTMYEARCVDVLEANMTRIAAGEEILNRVDVGKGY